MANHVVVFLHIFHSGRNTCRSIASVRSSLNRESKEEDRRDILREFLEKCTFVQELPQRVI